MLLTRPAILSVELRDSPEFSLENLISGAGGIAGEGRWFALAPHLHAEWPVEIEDLRLLQSMAAESPSERAELEAAFGPERVDRLIRIGLLIGDHPEHAQLRRRDQALRDTAWWGPAAVAHGFGRWEGVDVSGDDTVDDKRTLSEKISRDGQPPAEVIALLPRGEHLALPAPSKSDLDRLLVSRTTCRNFAVEPAVPMQEFSSLMHRVFAAQATQDMAAGVVMLKKNSPSGGGLHPIDAYVLVQRVEGLAAGLYHYHCVEHSLEPMRLLSTEQAGAAAHELVAGQSWFANAPVLVLMAARFGRTFWKYRNHAKAWKVIQLDAGHLSQNLYLSATEQGYGAFVTGAINDECAERLFELDGIEVGAIAVCGFGKRAVETTTFELDPLGKVVR